MIHVLLIEDNPGDARLMQELLSESGPTKYTLSHVDRISAAVRFLKEDASVKVVISDIALPDAQGAESFDRLRSIANSVPVIYITGTHDERMAVQALQRGAQDYLLKGQFDVGTLRRAIRYAIERKKFQSEVEDARIEARRLQEKTLLLKQESAQLMELNMAKDDFISLASHQLRTPATGVKQYIGLLLEGYTGPLSGEQRHFLELANESNERQLKIVSDLLRTAQIDAGRVHLRLSSIDLGELVSQIVAEQRDRFSRRAQSVELHIPDTPLMVSADSDRLRMALENIIDNAGKYTPAEKTIEVSVVLADKCASVEVRDEGVGIEPEDVVRVFDKFSRMANPLSDEVGGTGLGLYWTKKLIDLHGGDISVTSKVGSGTTFMVQLPITRPEAATKQPGQKA